MERISLADLDAAAEDFDRAVLATPAIDHFCSSSLWVLPAHEAIMGAPDPYILSGDGGTLALCRAVHSQGVRYLQPLEAAWGLACPLISADANGTAAAAIELLLADRDWDLMILSGVALGSQVFTALTSALRGHAEIRLGPCTRRHLASLDGGSDGFLSRRSRSFRRNLRRGINKARQAGVEFEIASADETAGAEALYERVLGVERRSWKGRQDSGIVGPQMQAFYADMIQRMSARGASRLVFAHRDGVDLAYILGGVLGDTYRGLQFSYDADHAHLSLGNLCQWVEIERLSAEGVEIYDLGTDVAYKRHWGESQFDTVALIVHRA